MRISVKSMIVILFSFIVISCNLQNKDSFKAKEVYKSGSLIITQVSENAFIHTSFKQTNDFGNVPATDW